MPGSAEGIRAGGAFYEVGLKNSPLVQGLEGAESEVKDSLKRVSAIKKRMLDADGRYQEKRAADGLRRAKQSLSENARKVDGAGPGQGLIKSLTGGLKNLGAMIGRELKSALTSPLAAIAAAIAPILGAKMFAEFGTQLVDMSRRTGASTKALQMLGFAARRTGSDVGAVEGVLTTIRDKLMDAARGGEDAQFAFMRLGLNFNELSRLSPEDRLKKIAQALNAIPNPALRAAAAQELLGTTDLLPMLQDLEKLEARSKRLGLVLGDDVVNAGKQLGNSLQDLHDNMLATVSVIGAKIAPAVSDLISKWVSMSGHTRALIADNTAMFSSAEALWAFLKLQWAKGSQFILEKFGMANEGIQGLWIDLQAALEAGWARISHGAAHAFGSVIEIARNVFSELARIGLKTAEALAAAFAYVSDDMSQAMQRAANMMAKLMAKLNLRDAAKTTLDVIKDLADQDNPELQAKLAAIEKARQDKRAALPGQDQAAAQARIDQLEKEYQEALAKAKQKAANAQNNGAQGPAGNADNKHGPGAPGIDAALMHVQGIGAIDLKTKEGFASAAASLRAAQLVQSQLSLQERQYIVQRDMRDRLNKLVVVGKK